MLTPRTAKNVLYVGIFAGLLVAVLRFILGTLVTLILLILPKTSTSFKLQLPSDAEVQVNNQIRLHLDTITHVFPDVSGWLILLLAALSIAYAALLFQLFSRAGAFVTRLLNDPFDTRNVHDLRFAANIALGFQGLGLLFSLGMAYLYRHFDIITQVEKTLNSLNPALKVSATPSPAMIGLNFWPLAAAATCAVLAAVFQRGHDLREQERRLREAQELTI